jgi:hypothetical protein
VAGSGDGGWAEEEIDGGAAGRAFGGEDES